MDVISKGHLKKFIEDFELENIPEKESDNFEKFCFYSIIGNECPSINEDDLNNINTEKNKGIARKICYNDTKGRKELC